MDFSREFVGEKTGVEKNVQFLSLLSFNLDNI